jgi:acetyl esterase
LSSPTRVRSSAAPVSSASHEDPRGELDPQVAALFDLLRMFPPSRLTDAQALRSLDAPTALGMATYVCEVASQQTIHIPGPRGPVRALVHHPGPNEAGPYPILVYLHGGGYVFGKPESCVHLTTQLCVDAQAVVVSVDYRLAPEHPFPQPLDDCLASLRWLREHGQTLGGDPSRIALVGDSAGANAVVAITLSLRDEGEPLPNALVLLCPWLDMTFSSESYLRYAPDDLLAGHAGMQLLRDSYLQGHSPRDPRVSPVFAELTGLPETMVVVGEIDPLHSDGVTFARKLEQQGGAVQLLSYRGMPHNFACMPFIDVAKESRSEVRRFLGRTLSAAAG